MPELPDILLYLHAFEEHVVGSKLQGCLVKSPSLLKTFSPALESCLGLELTQVSRCGKRIVWHFDDKYYVVFHLMIAGRFQWSSTTKVLRGKSDLARFDFTPGTLRLTEAGSKRRAGIWCFDNIQKVDSLNAGGVNVLESDKRAIENALLLSNNTLKRALTDPKRFDGIGNAYSDEILHAAKLSPLQRTHNLSSPEISRLTDAMRETLTFWIQHLQVKEGDRFPKKVTAFRPEMSVHGKFSEPCPVCGIAIQRIRYATNECNYCPGCQTDGKILADRSLSRLLKDDWPTSIDDLE